MFWTVLRDLGFFTFCFTTFTLIGMPLARQLRGLRSTFLLAPILGYGGAGFAVTLLYVYGLPARIIFCLMVVAAVGLAIMQRNWLLDACRTVGWGRQPYCRSDWWMFSICLCGALLLMMPQWTGGMQFAVFQQNVNDTFGYLTSAEVFSRESYAVINQAGDKDFLQNPLWCQAKSNLSCRPTVMILYAVVGQFLPSALHEMHYTFLAFFFSCAALAITWLLLNLGLTHRIWISIAAMLSGWGYATGFWGQYILDINAWSQIASMPLLVSIAGLLVILVDPRREDGNPDLTAQDHWRNSGIIALLTAAALYFYPENTIFHLVAFGPVALWAWFRGRRLSVLYLAGAVTVGLSLSLAYFHGTLGFFFDQSTAAGAGVNLWINTARFYFGRDGWYDGLEVALRKAWEVANPGIHNDGIAQMSFARSYLETFFQQGDNWRLLVGLPFDTLTGFMGLFFLSPLSSWPLSLQLLCRGALLALAIILLGGGMWRLFNQRDARVHNIVIFLGAMLLMGSVLVLKRQFWGAGKAISFASPYLAIFFVLPALLTRNPWARTAAGVWLVAQLAFGLGRPFWANDPRLLGRTPTYMTVVASKTTHSFNLGPLMSQLGSVSCVNLEIPDTFLEHYVMLALYANHIPFRFDHPVNTYFGAGKNLGLPVWTQSADCRVVMAPPTDNGRLMQLKVEATNSTRSDDLPYTADNLSLTPKQ